MFAKLDATGGIRIFFQVQSVLVLVVYGILFARELTMIVCFFVFVIGWTAILAAVTVIFSAQGILDVKNADMRHKLVAEGELSPEEARKIRGRTLLQDGVLLVKQWFRICVAVAWKELNVESHSSHCRGIRS